MGQFTIIPNPYKDVPLADVSCAGCGKPIHNTDDVYMIPGAGTYHQRCKPH